jgi:hypothetical protein
MRFGHVRVAAVAALSGGFLTLGALSSAQAAPLTPQGQAAATASAACQALPAAAFACDTSGAACALPRTPRLRKPPVSRVTAATRTCPKRIRLARLR